MTVSLGGIALDDNLRLGGELTGSAMAGSARPTFGGVCIQTLPVVAGNVLTLSATLEGNSLRGAFTLAQLQAIAALRDAGAPVALAHHLGAWQVWIPPDGIQAESVFDHADPDADEWYSGTITLITV